MVTRNTGHSGIKLPLNITSVGKSPKIKNAILVSCIRYSQSVTNHGRFQKCAPAMDGNFS